MLIEHLKLKLKKPPLDTRYRTFWQYIHIDIVLFSFVLLLCIAGLFILYSASSQNPRTIEFQVLRFVFAFAIMISIAQIPPATLQRFAPWIYFIGLMMLIIVLMMGHIGKGAQRWLNLGIMQFQPAELMKLAIP